MEFFTNIWNWIISYKDEIFSVVSSAELVALVSVIVSLFKKKKTDKKYNETSEKLNGNIEELKTISNDLTSMKSEFIEFKNDIKSSLDDSSGKICSELDEILSDVVKGLSSIEAILDVQSLAYTTVKDEKLRVAINNVINNAKFGESTRYNKLKNAIEELKLAISDNNSKIANQVSDIISNVETEIKPISETLNEESLPTRY